MLAGWLDVTMPHPEGGAGFGMTLDLSNNSISSLAEGGMAMAAGMNEGDLIVSIDGARITEFDGQPGPVGGTLLMTSEPQAIMPAVEALAPAPSHEFRLLRLIDPASIPESPLNSPMGYPPPPEHPPPAHR